MKRLWMSTLFGLVVMGLGLLMSGCEDVGSDNWEFENNSGYNVYVAPNGQDWSAFMLSPGSRVEVDYDGDRIQYLYTPSNKVRPDDHNRTVHFYNR